MGVGGLVGRDRELAVALSLLHWKHNGPATLILDGDAGIGKTTLCRAVSDAAAAAGFTILTTSGAASEVSMAWAGLADLIASIDTSVLDRLSPLHRDALASIRAGNNGPGDERLTATAFREALQQLSQARPVLVVVDDAQWLDESTRQAIGFALRRVTGSVAVLAAYRNGEPTGADHSWLKPADPRAESRLTVGPMGLDDLTTLIAAGPGPSPSQSDIQHIHNVSGGNPFYALELARCLAAGGALDSFPPTLTALVRDRIGVPDSSTREVLVTLAAAFEPTVEVIAAATDHNPADLIEVLQPLESRGVLSFDGARIRFTHPLIASGVTAAADPGVKRRAHRRLAEVVNHPEQRARHLALSSPHGDAETLAALDAAAESAAGRGAFSTAAELATLAIRLGGGDHIRRLRCADYHFRAGALDESESVLAPIIEDLPAGLLQVVGLMLLAAARGYRDGIASTIGLFERAAREADGLLRAQALVPLALATGIAGDMAAAMEYTNRARDEAESAGQLQLLSQACALSAHFGFIYGLGSDSEALRAALDHDASDPTMPVELQPTAVYAMNCAWTGRLEEGRTRMEEVLRRCAEHGSDVNVVVCNALLTSIEVALGRYAAAESNAGKALEHARQMGGLLPSITAQTALAEVAARRGNIEETRAAAELAVQQATASGLGFHVRAPLMSLAFAQVSDGRYPEALQTLAPLLATFDPLHHTEIVTGAWIPDAVEALTAVERVDAAEPLAAALEANGSRHDRPWMLAVGARCRALLHAAHGDLKAAVRSAEQAMKHHDRLPMPFERARTQLLLGQLLRRRRRAAAARAHLESAAAAFEHLGSPLWAARAHQDLSRLTTASPSAALTEAERQVAKRAAAGQSNKEIAATLFLSPKTVEMHLSHVYRKLGIRSRVQLVDGLRKPDVER